MLRFDRGSKYTRPDVKERAGLSRDVKGGNWDTGVVEHDNEFLIFANVGTEGRTGHNYGNRWEGSCLRWYHKAGSHLAWQSVQNLLEPGRSPRWTSEKRPYVDVSNPAIGRRPGTGSSTALRPPAASSRRSGCASSSGRT